MLHSCPFPYYCPPNSSAMKSCEEGSMPVNTSGLRGSKNSCCSVCEGGTYRPYLSPILQCLPCPAGYFCPLGTLVTTTNLPRSWCFILLLQIRCESILIQQVLPTTRVTPALLGMFVPWDPLSPCPVPLVPLVTSLTLRLWVTVIHVQLAPSTTCMPRRLVFPVAAPPPHQLVRAYQLILDYNLCLQLGSH